MSDANGESVYIALRYHGGDKIRMRFWTREQKPHVIGNGRGLHVLWKPHHREEGPEPPAAILYVPWPRVVQLRYAEDADVTIDAGGPRMPWEPV